MPDFENSTDWAATPHIVLLVDESGSMGVSRDVTVTSINDYLQGLKGTLPPTSRVTVVKFDTRWPNSAGVTIHTNRLELHNADRTRLERLFDNVPLSEVRIVTANDYNPTGGTPLNDAIGRTIRDVDSKLVETPSPVYFAILTDGEENESKEFTLPAVRALIEERTKQGWTFAFLGVAIDAYGAGGDYGISRGATVSVDRATIGASFTALRENVGRKQMFASTLSASGAGMASYNTWSESDELLSEEDKAKVEKE